MYSMNVAFASTDETVDSASGSRGRKMTLS